MFKKSFSTFFGVRGIKNIFKDTRSAFSSTKDSVSSTNNIVETFEEALERFNVQEDERHIFLKNKYDNYRKLSLIALFVFLLSLIYLTFHLINQSYLMVILNVLFAIWCFTIFFSHSFRAFQIRKQNLLSFKNFNIKEWYPFKIRDNSFFKKSS